jgi:pyrimidine-nucleoside phosphorylase
MASANSLLNPISIIEKKKAGETHTREEIHWLVQGAASGAVRTYQVSAWLMAACIQGLNMRETLWLTEAFVDSGLVLTYPQRPEGVVVVDKHSTGGVGDKVSLLLMPLLAAVPGVYVAKLAGHGLGMTGGTIDKVEAIPGFRTRFLAHEFVDQLSKFGLVLGQTCHDLAPVEKMFYDIRDVTATVDSIPLIASSVMSKKIATGSDVIILDVKCGRGAFMRSTEEGRLLAELCQQLAAHFGKRMVTVLSKMDSPIGKAVGLALEVEEVYQVLHNRGKDAPTDLLELTLKLGSLLLKESGLAATEVEGYHKLLEALESGKGYETFRRWLVAQGVDADEVGSDGWLPQSDRVLMVPAAATGYVGDIDALKLMEVMHLVGSARNTMDDSLEYGAGVMLHKQVGDAVTIGETIAELHCDAKSQIAATQFLKEAFTIIDAPVAYDPHALILEILPPVKPLASGAS